MDIEKLILQEAESDPVIRGDLINELNRKSWKDNIFPQDHLDNLGKNYLQELYRGSKEDNGPRHLNRISKKILNPFKSIMISLYSFLGYYLICSPNDIREMSLIGAFTVLYPTRLAARDIRRKNVAITKRFQTIK